MWNERGKAGLYKNKHACRRSTRRLCKQLWDLLLEQKSKLEKKSTTKLCLRKSREALLEKILIQVTILIMQHVYIVV